MDNPVIYVFVNKSLNMSAGKVAAQVAHAVMMVACNDLLEVYKSIWKESAHKTVLIMEARDTAHLASISQYLEDRNIETQHVIDEGVNEIDPHVPTAISTGILDKDNEHTEKTMSTFKLYRDKVKVTLEIDR